MDPSRSQPPVGSEADADGSIAGVFFRLSSWELAGILLAIVAGVTIGGVVLGRYMREHSETLKEPFGVMQAALLGLVGLILAFGLSLAVGRYEDRRAAAVSEANAIGTTYLRAQLLAEPPGRGRLPSCAPTPTSHSGWERRSRAALRCSGRSSPRI